MTRILLIDEDRSLLAALSKTLEAANYEVTRALTVAAAHQAVRETPPDLVLLDVEMTRGAGWALLDELVAAGLRVVVLSHRFTTDDVVRGFRAGATEYLAKPYRAEELLARLATRVRQAAPSPVQRITSAPLETPSVVDSTSEPAPQTEMPTLPLGQRLRAERKARNISLVQANLGTNIQMYYIQALEEQKYSLLPRGAATDDLVQRYATFLGDDPVAALAELRTLRHHDVEGPRDLGGQPIVRRRRWRWVLGLLLIGLLTCGITAGALALVFPTQSRNLLANVESVFADPTATALPTTMPTSAPTPPPLTLAPTVTRTATLLPVTRTIAAPTATSVVSATVGLPPVATP